MVAFSTIAACSISIANHNSYESLFAHESQLDIIYDYCIPYDYTNSTDIGDGEDEKWYEFVQNDVAMHFPHASSGTSEIRYFVSETALSQDDSTTWDDISNSSRREYIKASLINSIKKWNNISFYRGSYNGAITKHRIVNVIQGTQTNHNLTIYPFNDIGDEYANCGPSQTSTVQYIDTNNDVYHFHFDKWNINFNIAHHLYETGESEHILNRTGAHEFGHIMGLTDIDSCENSSSLNYHHEEIIMGYSKGDVLNRQSEITYKDLIGAAITRGFHTDADHQWILHSSGHGAYKLVCSICNGVKYVSSLDGIDYVDYKDCNDEHDLADGNMFAVASYGSSDYYKCKYCRYVAPFDDIEPQNYSKIQFDAANHFVTNQVDGLSYSFFEQHVHNNSYVNYTSIMHKAFCECGHYMVMPHAADMSRSYTRSGHTYAPCLHCGAEVEISGNGPIIPIPGSSNFLVTDNGSFIMLNGIYVIVEEDLESYLNGTLAFHLFGEESM